MQRIGLLRRLVHASLSYNDPKLEKIIMGISFRNPVGVAAGFDKNGEMADGLSAFGFGFVEIGTVTPLAQSGNPRPRLFRLRKDMALINRMGFNNHGVEYTHRLLRKRKTNIIVGGNLGKNKITPNDEAVSDYIKCFNGLYDVVDYFVINVSSPNTPGLRELQEKEPLKKIVSSVQQRNIITGKKPVLIKIAPDLNNSQIDDVVEIIKDTGLEGIIATNTTLSRENLLTDPEIVKTTGDGGLSGKPLLRRSVEVVQYLRDRLGPDYVIIGVGGIMKPDDAVKMIEAGADLVQVYTGFIYRGPGIAKKICKKLAEYYSKKKI